MLKKMFVLLLSIFMVALAETASAATVNGFEIDDPRHPPTKKQLCSQLGEAPILKATQESEMSSNYVVEKFLVSEVNGLLTAVVGGNGNKVAICIKLDDPNTYQTWLKTLDSNEMECISDPDVNSVHQRISDDGKFVVWHSYPPGGGKFRGWSYNTFTEELFPFQDANEPNQTFLDVDRGLDGFYYVAYCQYPLPAGNSDVYGARINADGNGISYKFPICTLPSFQYKPVISCPLVATEDLRSGRNIYKYDITDPCNVTETLMTYDAGEKLLKGIDNSWISYTRLYNDEHDAYIISEPGSPLAISAEAGVDETGPDISGCLVAFTKMGNGYDIYCKNILTGKIITIDDSPGDQYDAYMNGNTIVYIDDSSGKVVVRGARIYAITDFNRDGITDFMDFAILADQWLFTNMVQD